MPIPLRTEITPPTPNALKYDLSISSRVERGRLVVSATACVAPVNYDANADAWTDCYAEPKTYMVPDLEQYAAANPDMAPLVGQAWAALNALVDAINAKEKLL